MNFTVIPILFDGFHGIGYLALFIGSIIDEILLAYVNFIRVNFELNANAIIIYHAVGKIQIMFILMDQNNEIKLVYWLTLIIYDY